MHCITLAELAAVLSQHTPAFVYRRATIPSAAMVQYWATSRHRFDLWHRTMARYGEAERSGDAMLLRRWWREHLVVLEEVMVSEMLTRVVATLGAALDAANDTEEIEPITHAIYLSHLEASNRVQNMMLRGRGNSVQEAVRLNRLRSGVERWTDALLGRMCAQTPDQLNYGFDQKRAISHAIEHSEYGVGAAKDTAAWLMNAALRDMLSRRTTQQSALPKANSNVAESVMMMLQQDLFDGFGALKTLWMQRIELDYRSGDTAPPHDELNVELDEDFDVDEIFKHDLCRWNLK